MTIIDRESVAVVIGGGSGVGRGIALGLADAGASVMVADIEPDAAERVAHELHAAGHRAANHKVDSTDPASLAALLESTLRAFGGVHIVSNNVGVVFSAELANATEAEWGWGIELNLLSMVRSVNVFLPHLDGDTSRAHIVNTASMAAIQITRPEQTGGVHLGIYHATKHAVLGYTESLRNELAPRGIGVSVLCPGQIESNLAVTSLRNRPDAFGGPEIPDPNRTGNANPMAMPQEAVGPIVVAGVRGDRFHILTHPSGAKAVARRAKRLADDFAFFGDLDQHGW